VELLGLAGPEELLGLVGPVGFADLELVAEVYDTLRKCLGILVCRTKIDSGLSCKWD